MRYFLLFSLILVMIQAVYVEPKSVFESEIAMEDIETIIDDLGMVPINIGGDPDD